ncbi:KamA family radical SAM protein [Nitrospina gracilis]|uniref:KamA family radical SAM protein n=1 Tax=Nitrospina gracilis TaxID=35801 RepID=UPI001EFF6503|nr:KamA family radical SAM protein [Nitrospina gracilis]MCF8721249.1 KamA family protein [Nitrospina gracilis Nb-211]
MFQKSQYKGGDKKPKYLTKLGQIPELSQENIKALEPVSEQFIFRTNEYYQSLIDWDDPDDPIRKIVIPDVSELNEWGRLDASDEESYTVAHGIEHKYDSTALLLVNEVCAAYCRFCFRKRLFMDENDEVTKDISEGLAYIREHPEINNVLLTGGDPLIMSTSKLEPIIRQVREIDHVKIIRIGTKIPAFNPMRIYNDDSLRAMFEKYSLPEKRIYVMAHFNHPRELTEEAVRGLNFLMRSGAIVVNQTPMIAGVNDDPQILSELMNRLSFMGVPPYYVFHCRPTLGNRPYTLPIEKAYEIFELARMRGSGLAKRARFVMSHSTGKIEIIGLSARNIYFKYQRAAENRNSSRFMVYRRNPEAFWFDDYHELVDDYILEEERALRQEPVLDFEFA